MVLFQNCSKTCILCRTFVAAASEIEKNTQTLKSLKSKSLTLGPSIEIRIKCLVKIAPDYGLNTVFKFKYTSNQKHQSTNKQTVNDRPSLIGNNNIAQSFITLIFPILIKLVKYQTGYLLKLSQVAYTEIKQSIESLYR